MNPMFGKFRDSNDPLPRPPRNTGAGSLHRSPADFGFPVDSKGGSVPAPGSLATYDRLGQTLVATPTVATLSGPDAAALASQMCEQIHEAHHGPDATGVRHIVLDLQNVQYMDSMCVGVLVELLTTLKEAGGHIALVNASSNVEYLFKLTRLDRVFPICRDVMKAIEVVERGG
jgi:anti-sigma B factor antagonist